ncbi:MAG: hypothetical protein KatS3mg068_0257 [Candidatus Sericytochromatia bacterium]|nr:MAG: hypothetical protein KatS3mg068_0257 [Candidatus Sericytochromatia bacterium]
MFSLLKLSEEDKNILKRTLYLAIIIRIALFITAYVVGYSIAKYNVPIHNFIYLIFAKWDAINFLYLAEYGYTNFGEERKFLAYLPLYPALINVFSYIFQTYMASALFINFVCSIIAGFYIQKLALLDYDDSFSKRVLYYFYLFPIGYFLFVPYTEALFLALVISSFYYMRNKKWLISCLLISLSTATRIQGLGLIPIVLIEMYLNKREIKIKHLFYSLILPLGFIVYLFINYYISGNFFEFLKIQKEYFYHQNILPTTLIYETIKEIINSPLNERRILYFEFRLIFILFAIVIFILSFKWMRFSYQLFSWSQLLVLMTDSWPISMPRYIFSIFTIYFVLAYYIKDTEKFILSIIFSSILMTCFFCMYSVGNWAF